MAIAPFKDRNKEPDQAVVDLLKEALDLAEKGELREVAVFGIMIGGNVYKAWTEGDAAQMIGVAEIWKHGLIRALPGDTGI